MLLVFCGDHTAASRDALSAKRSAYIKGGREIKSIDASEVIQMIMSGGSDAHDLFSGAPVYETTNLVAVFKRKYARKAKEELRALVNNASVELLDWEDRSAYDLGLTGEKGGWIHDSPMPESTFSLLPLLVPGKSKEFLRKLRSLSLHQPIEMTFFMIVRHVKLMILLAADAKPKDSPYLVNTARTGLRSWDQTRLVKFYHQLQKVEMNTKTGSNTPLSLRDQLEIVIMMML
ncbi:MAG: hypothetical protein WCJ70_02150 [bacterium]